MKRNQEQINIPIKLPPSEHQYYRDKLFFEGELRKLVPDLARAEGFGYLLREGLHNFSYYKKGEPDVRYSSYFTLKNGMITFTGILNGRVEKYPVKKTNNNY